MLLFLVAFTVTIPQFRNGHFGAGFEPVAIARSLVEGHGYSSPFSILPTGPTAHTPPLFPAFLAFLILVFGYSFHFAVAACVCCALVYALGAALLPSLADLFFQRPQAGIWAAGLLIALPVFEFMPQFETVFAVTAAMLFYLASNRLAQRAAPLGGLWIGIFAGLIALLHTASVLIIAPWLVWLAWQYPAARRPVFVLAAALGLLLALAPWTLRNYRQFHAIFLVRDNLGAELYVSNNGLVGPSVKTGNPIHPSVNRDEASALGRMGEFNYNRQRMSVALLWIRTHPTQFLALTAARFRIFWLTAAQVEPVRRYSIAFVSFAGFCGFALLAVRRRPVCIPLAAVLLLYPLVFYVVQVDHRFREPILWFSLLGAGYFFSTVFEPWFAGWGVNRPLKKAS